MTYNVFGGMLNLAQSINPAVYPACYSHYQCKVLWSTPPL